MLKKIFLLALLFTSFCTVCLANVSFMPVRDLRPGMRGIGKTVVSGATIEEFDVEILGVNGSAESGYSILVRLSGDLIERTGGVAQGMSGSPVYVDGRLVGAVAFGRAFNDPRYCFLTPIGQMLRLLDRAPAQTSDWFGRAANAEAKEVTETATTLLPAGTSLLAGGFQGYGLDYLGEQLATFGLDVLSAGAVSGEVAAAADAIEPGSSIAVSLMQGDLTLGALGTVTWRDDAGNLLAFGHPFMQNGDSNFFLTSSWVLGIIPNVSSNYKIGNIGAPIGRVFEDRSSGIAAQLGKEPPSVPVYINVSDLDNSMTKSARVRIVDEPRLLPALLDSAVVNMVAKSVDRTSGGTARFTFRISAFDSKGQLLAIERENIYYATDSSLYKAVDRELTDTATILMRNKLESVNVHGVTVQAEFTREPRVAEIVRVKARQRSFKPGDAIALEVVMKPYRGPEFTETLTYKVPTTYQQEKLVLNVRGGSSLAWIKQLLRKQQEEGLAAPNTQEKAKTLADYAKSVNEADKNNELIVDIVPQAAPPAQTAAQAAPELGLSSMLEGSPNKLKRAYDFIIDGEAELILTRNGRRKAGR